MTWRFEKTTCAQRVNRFKSLFFSTERWKPSWDIWTYWYEGWPVTVVRGPTLDSCYTKRSCSSNILEGSFLISDVDAGVALPPAWRPGAAAVSCMSPQSNRISGRTMRGDPPACVPYVVPRLQVRLRQDGGCVYHTAAALKATFHLGRRFVSSNSLFLLPECCTEIHLMSFHSESAGFDEYNK